MKNIYKQIATTLKKLRHERGWSLDKTAEKTGVSKAMLGQIEREESSPTIATLWKIASGFQTSFSSFIEDLSPDFKKPIRRAGKTKHLHPQDQKIRVMPIFPFDQKLQVEMFIIDLLPGCEHLSPSHGQDVFETIVVTEGEIELLVDGTWQSLKKGEGLRFKANKPHGYRNLRTKIASFHDTIHYLGHKS